VSDIVIFTCRTEHDSLAAIWSGFVTVPARSSSSQRRPLAMVPMTLVRVSDRIGRRSDRNGFGLGGISSRGFFEGDFVQATSSVSGYAFPGVRWQSTLDPAASRRRPPSKRSGRYQGPEEWKVGLRDDRASQPRARHSKKSPHGHCSVHRVYFQDTCERHWQRLSRSPQQRATNSRHVSAFSKSFGAFLKGVSTAVLTQGGRGTMYPLSLGFA
jgi:hypothetical protein